MPMRAPIIIDISRIGATRLSGAPDVSALPPGWTVHWLDQAGHLPQLEAAGEVNALLRALL